MNETGVASAFLIFLDQPPQTTTERISFSFQDKKILFIQFAIGLTDLTDLIVRELFA
jgi:hypothetical protein